MMSSPEILIYAWMAAILAVAIVGVIPAKRKKLKDAASLHAQPLALMKD